MKKPAPPAPLAAPPPSIAPSPLELEGLKAFIGQSCGLSIPPEKYYLIEQRLQDLARTVGEGHFGRLYQKLLQDESGSLRDQVIEAITTNETSFFRDAHPFQTIMEHVLPTLSERLVLARKAVAGGDPPTIRFWCSGASTGQEPYSLAMTVSQFVQANRHRGIDLGHFQIVATDISQQALNRGKAGLYSDFEVGRGFPESLRAKFLDRKGDRWKVKESLQSLIKWLPVNLLGPIGLLGTFHLILCRNVLIYFDGPLKAGILDKFHRMLEPEGFLMLGATEMLIDPGPRFSSRHFGNTILYQKIGG